MKRLLWPLPAVSLTARLIAIASIGSFVSSLFLPAFFTGSREWPGFELFLMGWLGTTMLQFGWYANPLLFASWWLGWHDKYAAALLAGGLATLLALSARLMTTVMDYSSGGAQITAFAEGFTLWVVSCAIAAVGFGIIAAWSFLRGSPKNAN